MKKIYTLDELKSLVEKYQRVLRLQDWDIKVELVPRDTLSPHRDGEIELCMNFKKAVLRLSTPETFKGNITEPEQNMEHVLIHEILHLHFAGIDEKWKGIENNLYEIAINKIAEGIETLSGSDKKE